MWPVTRKSRKIRGVEIPPRRFTGWAAVYFICLVALPVLGAALALDVLLYLLFDRVFGLCYGILCFAG